MSINSGEWVIVEFRRRRRQMRHSFLFAIALIALGLLVRQLADSFPDLFGLSRQAWSAVATGQIIAAVIIAVGGFWQYRCPACRQLLRDTNANPIGVALDPDRCPHCGARLR